MTTTTQKATTRATTNFINYDHLEESLLDYSSINYDDDDIRTDSEDRTEQQRPDTEPDSTDDDDDDDDDKDEIPDDLETSGGHEIGGAIGGRRDVIEWYEDDATPKKETLHPWASPHTTATTIWRISDLSITGNSFLRETDPPTKIRISLDLARNTKMKAPPPTRDKPRERDTLKSKEASVGHSGSTTVFSNLRTSTFVSLIAVVCRAVRW